MLENFNPEKTPVDVLLFADDLTAIWYYEHMIPGSSVYDFGLKLADDQGMKQFTDEEYAKYLEYVEKTSPESERVCHYVENNDFCSAHHTARSYAMYKLGHELRKKGYTVQVIIHFWYHTEEDFKKIFEKFVGDNTLMVGFSQTFHSAYNPWALFHSLYMPPQRQRKVKEWINEINPNTKLVSGGSPHTLEVLLDKRFDSAMLDMDIINVGYAEATIFEMLDDIKAGTEWPVYTDRGSRLDILNSTMSYCEEDGIVKGDEMPLETSRGCIFSCSFCNFGLLGKEKGTYIRKQSLIQDELKRNWEENGIYKYWVMDDTFNEDSDKLKLVAEAKHNANIPLELSAFIRLDLQHRLKQEQLLLDCGVFNPHYGIESLNPLNGPLIGKGWNPLEQFEYLWELKNGIFKDKVQLFSSFVVGLPEDNRESLQLFREQILDPKFNPLDYLMVNYMFIRDLSAHQVTTSGDENFQQTGSKIDRNPEEYGYDFPVEEANRLQAATSGAVVRYWRNKHGITYTGAERYVKKLNEDFHKSRGWMPKLTATYHKIPQDAEKTDYMKNYWQEYWSKIMSVKQHTVYNSVQWVNEGKITEFKPI
jgi:radical SAM superfamily enzyme YgiQ (UPF0313 family)